jgi:acylglycerol lipase
VAAKMALTETWLEGPDSIQFYTRYYTPPTGVPIRAVLVYVHGYLDYISHLAFLHERFAARGVAVFAFDQRGFGMTGIDPDKNPGSFGRTGGHKERMTDIAWAVKEAKSRVDKQVPLFLMGYSSVRSAFVLKSVSLKSYNSREVLQWSILS